MPKIAMHRGSTSTMTTTAKKNIVLEDGEFFIEVPDSITDSNQYKFKVGDGVTTYENLPYALDPTNMAANDDDATYVENTNVTLSSSEPTSVVFTDSAISALSNIEVYCNQDIGYTSITKSNGSCTVVFPKQDSATVISVMIRITENYYKSISMSGLGNATAAQVYEGYTFSSENGILLTGTASSGGAPVELNEIKTCSLSGSHTVSSYQCTVCYLDSTQVCLLGNSNLASSGVTWSVACGYTWTATFAADALWSGSPAKTITGVKIPTADQASYYCINRERGGYYDQTEGKSYSGYSRFTANNRFWTSTIVSSNSSYAWFVNSTGTVTTGGVSGSGGVVPYIVISL